MRPNEWYLEELAVTLVSLSFALFYSLFICWFFGVKDSRVFIVTTAVLYVGGIIRSKLIDINDHLKELSQSETPNEGE